MSETLTEVQRDVAELARELIDRALTELRGRDLISTNEASDMLLDVRLVLTEASE